MKLKTKLLTFLAPAALISTVAPIALTSCGGDQSGATTITYSGQKEFTISNAEYSMEFNLDKALGSGWTLTCGLHGSISGSMIVGPKSDGVTVSGTKVTVACKASKTIGSLTPGDNASYGLTFTCKDSSFNELWKVNIDGFKTTYQNA